MYSDSRSASSWPEVSEVESRYPDSMIGTGLGKAPASNNPEYSAWSIGTEAGVRISTAPTKSSQGTLNASSESQARS